MNTEAQTSTDFEIPDSFDYNETDLDRPRDQLRVTEKDEIFKGVVTKVYRDVQRSKKNPEQSSNNMQLKVALAALDGEKKVGLVYHWVTIPIQNPKVTGHKPYANLEERDKQFQRAREFIRSVMGDEALPPFPKKREDGSYFLPDTGETVEMGPDKGYQRRVKEIDDKTIKFLQAWYKDPVNGNPKLDIPSPVNAVLYFATKKNEKSGYINVSYVRHDDGGKRVVTENFTS